MNTTLKLTAGTIRKEGDLVRSIEPTCYPCVPQDRQAQWRPCTLIGHPITLSDLKHLEFMRPKA